MPMIEVSRTAISLPMFNYIQNLRAFRHSEGIYARGNPFSLILRIATPAAQARNDVVL
jgi:hypothetical protein